MEFTNAYLQVANMQRAYKDGGRKNEKGFKQRVQRMINADGFDKVLTIEGSIGDFKCEE